MGRYLASQIIKGALTYEEVMKTRWGKMYKKQIDETIDKRGYKIAEDGKCVPKTAEDTEEKPPEN